MPEMAQAAGSKMFLEIEGVNGEGSAPGKDQIELFSFAWGVSRVVTGNSAGGGGAGRVAAKDFTISKRPDSSSPKLMEACVQGQQIKLARVHLWKGDSHGKLLEYQTYTMEKVMVTSFAVDGSGDPPVEAVSLNFSKLIHEYSTGGGPKQSTTWSLQDMGK